MPLIIIIITSSSLIKIEGDFAREFPCPLLRVPCAKVSSSEPHPGHMRLSRLVGHGHAAHHIVVAEVEQGFVSLEGLVGVEGHLGREGLENWLIGRHLALNLHASAGAGAGAGAAVLSMRMGMSRGPLHRPTNASRTGGQPRGGGAARRIAGVSGLARDYSIGLCCCVIHAVGPPPGSAYSPGACSCQC